MARGADPAGQQDRHPPDPSSFDAAHAYHREGPEGGRVVFHRVWGEVEAVPASLRAVTLFRGCADRDVLATVAGCLAPAEFEPGDVIVSAGQPADALFVIAHGKVAKVGRGRSGKGAGLAILSGGDHFGSGPVADPRGAWEYTAKALTAVTALTLSRTTLRRLLRLSGPPWKLGEPAHLSRYSTVDY